MQKNQELPERAKEIHLSLKDKSFGIKDIRKIDENDVRQLRYWVSLGMITGNKTKKDTHESDNSSWDKFSFYEFIWILIIRELKKMNFDNTIIINCASEIFGRKDTKYNKMLLFEKAILFSLTHREVVFFIVNKKGEFDILRPQDLERIDEEKEFSPCVLINLLPLIKGFLMLKDFRKYIIEKKLLKQNETKALELLLSDSNTEVKIIFEKTDVTINGSETGVKDFIETILTRKYQKIIIQL